MAESPSSFKADARPSLVRTPSLAPVGPASSSRSSTFWPLPELEPVGRARELLLLVLPTLSEKEPSSHHCPRSNSTGLSLFWLTSCPSTTITKRNPSSIFCPGLYSLVTTDFTISYCWVDENNEMTGDFLRPFKMKFRWRQAATSLPRTSPSSAALMQRSSDLPHANAVQSDFSFLRRAFSPKQSPGLSREHSVPPSNLPFGFTEPPLTIPSSPFFTK
mmetsp:Transcript_69377/g.224317  ORF Transcript_69377/g.224317 Transcript_69377/m.224317 type:complete len:218 (+) Transcript_69377:1416-2069(+)